MVWSQGSTVVVNFNDHNGGQYSGMAYSTNGGATFTQPQTSPFATGHGQNFGDPIVVYNAKLGKWFAGDLATGCGGQGIGMWSSPDGITWTTGACAHNGGSDDRESMWVDNNPASKGYGRMYIPFTNFNVGSGALQVVTSDDGTTWTNHTLSNTFFRPVQVTGTPILPIQSNVPLANVPYSTVFVASMNEEGGGLSTRQNVMWRSTDGGSSWTQITMGAVFPAVGDGVCASNSYFARVFPIWRHMGWGEPAAGPNQVVHYVYAGKASANDADHGNVYYTRSADNGTTWSTPIQLNTDPNGQFKTQWMPSLSATNTGKVTASWYDRRQASSACNVATDPGCMYERYARQSSDNGATWGPDFAVSSALIEQPQQQDGGVQSCYAGDYDYDTGTNSNALVTWTDGRRNVGGVQVQDVMFAAVPQ